MHVESIKELRSQIGMPKDVCLEKCVASFNGRDYTSFSQTLRQWRVQRVAVGKALFPYLSFHMQKNTRRAI